MQQSSNRIVEGSPKPLIEEVERRVALGDYKSMILLVPTRARARELLARFVRVARGGALGGIEILTIPDFASKLLRVLAPRVRVIGDAEMAVFLELAIKELHANEELHYFERKAQTGARTHQRGLPMPHGTFEVLLNTIRALKESAVTPENIAQEIILSRKKRGESTELRRAKDILAIYKKYEARLGETLTDTYGQLSLVASGLAALDKKSLSTLLSTEIDGVNDLFVQGFLRLERSSLELFRQIVSRDLVRVTVETPKRRDNHDLFRSLELLEHDLFEVGLKHRFTAVPTQEPTDSRSSVTALSDYLGQKLFTVNATRDTERLDCTESVHVWAADSREKEVERIARQIKLIFESDPLVRADPSRICIATPLEREYALLFRSAFLRYGIPASVTDRYKLDTAGLTAGIVSILGMVSGGLNRRDLLRALSTPYFELRGLDGSPIDAANLKLVADREQLIGNTNDWLQKLDERLSALEIEIRETPDSTSELRSLLETRDGLQKAKLDVNSLQSILRSFERSLTPTEFRQHLFRFFGTARVRATMLRDSTEMIEAKALEHETRSYGAIVKLVEELTVICELLGVGDESLPISFYIDRLRTAASIARFTPRFNSGSVFVTSLEQLLGTECDYLFVPGLVDGRFPSRFEPQVFLMESHQKNEEKQRGEERILFYQTITSFRKQLFLSYPGAEDDGAQTTASTFLEALKSNVIVSESISDRLKHDLFSDRELHRYLGKKVVAGSSVNESLDALDNITPIPEKPLLRERLLRDFVPLTIRLSKIRQKSDPNEFVGTLRMDELTAEQRMPLESFADHVWSVSQLESYAKCPFQFLMRNIMHVNTPVVVEDGLEASERGSLIHDILYDLFTERRNSGQLAVRDIESLEERQSFKEHAMKVAHARISLSGNTHPFHRLDSETAIGEHAATGLFDELLKAERTLRGMSHVPTYFEVGFGMAHAAASETDRALRQNGAAQLSPKLKLRGKIDRLDMDADTFSVVDYKTGSAPKLKDITAGRSLQLPLYLRSAQQVLKTQAELELEPVAGIYELVRSGKRELGVALADSCGEAVDDFRRANNQGVLANQKELDVLIENTIRQAERYADGVMEGKFPLVAEENVTRVCTYCEFRSACRQREALKYGALGTRTL